VPAAIALLVHELGDPVVGAQVGQITDVAGTERFD
jgi:hypothetical protein